MLPHFTPEDVQMAVFPLAETLRLKTGTHKLATGTQTREVITFRWMCRGKGGGVAPNHVGTLEGTAALLSMYMYWLSRTRGAGWRAAASATLARSRTAPLSTAG